MSVLNTNSLNTIDASKNLANESHLNDTTKTCENRELNENSKPKTSTTAASIAKMPAATNPMSATVTVLNSNAPFPTSDQCSDSEEDFDRTTRNLGAHKWIFNYKDVSSTNSHCILFPKMWNALRPNVFEHGIIHIVCVCLCVTKWKCVGACGLCNKEVIKVKECANMYCIEMGMEAKQKCAFFLVLFWNPCEIGWSFYWLNDVRPHCITSHRNALTNKWINCIKTMDIFGKSFPVE